MGSENSNELHVAARDAQEVLAKGQGRARGGGRPPEGAGAAQEGLHAVE